MLEFLNPSFLKFKINKIVKLIITFYFLGYTLSIYHDATKFRLLVLNKETILLN